MKLYKVLVEINEIHADDEEHALEQALDMIADGQFTPEVKES